MKKAVLKIAGVLGTIATAFAAASYFTDEEDKRKNFFSYYNPRNWIRNREGGNEECYEVIDPAEHKED